MSGLERGNMTVDYVLFYVREAIDRSVKLLLGLVLLKVATLFFVFTLTTFFPEIKCEFLRN